jgi:transcriptional regulator with XRE-family HTH domain
MKENTSTRLKAIMSEQNLKQVDIIKKCEPYCIKYDTKLTKNYLSQYVSGKVDPGQRTLSILGMALNVNEAWLMGYDVPRDRNLIPQSYDSPVLNAVYNFVIKDSEVAYKFITKKVVDNIDFEAEDLKLLSEFKKLNHEGKHEAINRIIELTFVPKYTNNNQY